MANTNQGLRQLSVRAVTGTTLDYCGDFLALFAAAGISQTRGFNGGLLEWINIKLSTSYTSLPTAMNAFAINQSVTNWDALGTFDASTGAYSPSDDFSDARNSQYLPGLM